MCGDCREAGFDRAVALVAGRCRVWLEPETGVDGFSPGRVLTQRDGGKPGTPEHGRDLATHREGKTVRVESQTVGAHRWFMSFGNSEALMGI